MNPDPRTKPARSRCGRTGKTIYNSHAHAMHKAGQLIMSKRWHSNVARAYRCDFCGGWHITSNDTKPTHAD